MNSLISIRTIADSSSNITSANALHNSVLPTPVGPRNRNEPIGRLGSCNPLRLRRTASATACTASSCPITRWCKRSSITNNLARSVSNILVSGTPVQALTTSAISSSVTSCLSSRRLSSPSSVCSACSSSSLACCSRASDSSIRLCRSLKRSRTSSISR